jgi:5'-deoxy-5'-methylthioadenosine phosphorylase
MLAIIGGSGLTSLDGLVIHEQRSVDTPFGQPSSDVLIGEYAGRAVMFLPRHGQSHQFPPHKINYRANIWALHHLGATHVLAIAAVGGIRDDMAPGVLALPDQIIDYTYGREQSFFSDDFTPEHHIDFTYPYDNDLRARIVSAANFAAIPLIPNGTYGATQGPRLETAAEIQRLAKDGCAMVGMTGMPEAALARELKLAYATVAVMANWAAGLSDSLITMQVIEQTIQSGMSQIKRLIGAVIQQQ